MSALTGRLKRPTLAALRTIGLGAVGAPRPPRASGGYGRACRGALILLFLIGAVVSVLLPSVGLGIMIVSGLALFQFFLLQYDGALLRLKTVAWLLAVGVVICVVIGVVWSDWEGRDGAAGDVLVLIAVIAGASVLVIVRRVFQMIFGPHHPVSALPEPNDPPTVWFWVGAVGPTRATVVARTADSKVDSIIVECTPRAEVGGPGGPSRSITARPDEHGLARLGLAELEPDLRYEVRVGARHGDATVGASAGSFTTFPPAGQPASLTLAFGSCMSTGSKGRVFDTIAGLEPKPRIFVVTGDLHYENLTANDTEPFLDAYDRVHASPPLSRLFRSMPMAYVWDDHDFGDNDSGHDSPSKDAAQSAYRLAVPSYVEPDRVGAIHQEFTIGRVRVVITDNRSERGATPGHLVEPAAEAWLIDRIADASVPVVVWVSPTPWIGDDANSDNWAAYPEQRRRIATQIGDRCKNLVMVSGDAHMVAIDDGEFSAYAGEGSGFPVLQAAALDRLGSAKGGPFSHGRYAGAGQFGLVTVDDRGHEIGIELAGRSWSGAEIISHSFTIPVTATPAASPPPRKGESP